MTNIYKCCFFLFKIKDTWSPSRRNENSTNPFSRGSSFLNCFSTLCGPLPPSFLNLRAKIKQDNSTLIEMNYNNNNQHDSIGYLPDENGLRNNRVVRFSFVLQKNIH